MSLTSSTTPQMTWVRRAQTSLRMRRLLNSRMLLSPLGSLRIVKVPKYAAVQVDAQVSKYKGLDDSIKVPAYEYELVSGSASDAGDLLNEEPFVPDKIYYSKTMNPKALGTPEELRERARRGIRRRKWMNESNFKKIKRGMVNLASVLMACTVAAASLTQEIVTGPLEDTFEVFKPFMAYCKSDGQREVDCLELFAGRARISEGFAKRGRGVLQPRDIKFGHDLRDRSTQEQVLKEISQHEPGLIWMAPPCTLWCGFSRLNYNQQQLRRLRKKEMELVRFVDSVVCLQRKLGGLVVIENPANSDLWRTDVLQDMIGSGMSFARADLCSYGMKSLDGEALLKKPVSLLTNSAAFNENVQKVCTGDHDHRTIQGAETAHSATYPTGFATAVFHAYNKSCSHAHSVMTAEAPSSVEDKPSSPSAVERKPDDVEEPHGAKAISFKGKVSPEIASVLKRVHQNLGHPSNRDLIKHLRIAGAGENISRAAEQMTCNTCARSGRAPLHKVSAPVVALDFNEAVAADIVWLDTADAKPVVALDFNEAVAADIVWLDTADAKNKPALNMVDLASTYQVVVPLKSTKSEDVSEAFSSGWIQWAGAPKFVLVDLDSAFKDKFLALMDNKSVVVRAAAGQAHWQNGVAERHGGAWKMIWNKFVEDNLVFVEEMPEAMSWVSDAKNQLRNRSGYSPRQWVFGSNGRQPADLFDMDQSQAEMLDLASPDAKFERSQVLRAGARAAFFACQSKEALQRASNHKPRVEKKNFEPGDLVYAYREVKQGKGKKPKSTWLGPGIVIGREGNNFWLSRGGRCILAAPEHLRTAHHEEVSELLRLKTAMKELKSLMEQPFPDEEMEVDEDFLDPAPEEQESGPIEMEAENEGPPDSSPLPLAWDEAASREQQIRASVRRAQALDDVPTALKKARLEAPKEVFMVKRCISEKGKEKQLEKELPWGLIPYEERHLYREAELKQWKEHVEFGAVRALSLEESRRIEATIPPERVLNARFAYKDKNYALRKVDPSIPCKPKARLCVAGHRDPDLGRFDMAVDAPTTSRHSILLALQLGLSRGWSVSVGDIRAAFLNGVPAPRQLYFRQPRGGIPSLQPGQLVEVLKGVFGLSTSPKLWWMKLSKDVQAMVIEVSGRRILVKQNPIDPCVFHFYEQTSQAVVGLLLTHVDDLMLIVEPGLEATIQKEIKDKFPIDEWQSGSFEYVGCSYHCSANEIKISQKAYVEGRVDKVTAKTNADGSVSREQVEENRTSIGSLSWLAKQTRPDLQFAVSQAQRKQSDPSTDDIKKTNKLVDIAFDHKDHGVTLKKIPEKQIAFIAFHDAAWANVSAEDPDIGDSNWSGDHPVASQLAHVIVVSDKRVLEGEEHDFSLIDWRSKSSQRVCRSSFAGETMVCCEAVEHAVYLRSLFLSFASGCMVSEVCGGEKAPLHCITDCKSLFDHLHREGTPKAPSEKRLAIDLAGLRQILMREAKQQFVSEHGPDLDPTPERPCRPPIHWAPTELQLADILKKKN